MARRTQQAGFTLVELVIVILILGILSAVALPRFINLGQDARYAKAQGLYGAVRSAAQITRAAALVGGATAAATGTVTMDGATIDTNYGYPQATIAGIITAAGIDTASDGITLSGAAAAAGTTLTITINGGSATCRIRYTSSNAANVAPTIVLDAADKTAC